MNPVRSFAPDLIRGDLNTTWIYVVLCRGSLTGAVIDVCFEWIPKGTATAAGTLAAQGEIFLPAEEATFAPLRSKYER